MDFTAVWFLTVASVVGYLTVGLIIGSIVAELIYRDDGDTDDARIGGGISAGVWPIATIVLLGAGLWLFIIRPLLTPRAARAMEKEERAKRKAEGKPAIGAYVD